MSLWFITACGAHQLGEVQRYGQCRGEWERGEAGSAVVRSGEWVLVYGGVGAGAVPVGVEVYAEYRLHGTACMRVTH